MNELESYKLCAPAKLVDLVKDLDKQSASVLDLYQSLQAQRSVMLEALGIQALSQSVENLVSDCVEIPLAS